MQRNSTMGRRTRLVLAACSLLGVLIPAVPVLGQAYGAADASQPAASAPRRGFAKKGKTARIELLKKQEAAAKEEEKAKAEQRAEARRKALADKKTATASDPADTKIASSDEVAPVVKGTKRDWTDATGKFHVNAELVDVKDGAVKLKKSDGKTISVQLNKLSTQDQAALRKFAPSKATN